MEGARSPTLDRAGRPLPDPGARADEFGPDRVQRRRAGGRFRQRIEARGSVARSGEAWRSVFSMTCAEFEAWREVAKRGGTDTRTDTKFSGERKAKPCKRGELGRGN